MIKKITIRDVATFDKKGIVMDNLQKVNIVYGGNGAGKTTTSRVLEYGYAPKGHKQTADTTIVKPWKYPTCEVDWDGEPAKVLVYNKDFREDYPGGHRWFPDQRNMRSVFLRVEGNSCVRKVVAHLFYKVVQRLRRFRPRPEHFCFRKKAGM